MFPIYSWEHGNMKPVPAYKFRPGRANTAGTLVPTFHIGSLFPRFPRGQPEPVRPGRGLKSLDERDPPCPSSFCAGRFLRPFRPSAEGGVGVKISGKSCSM